MLRFSLERDEADLPLVEVLKGESFYWPNLTSFVDVEQLVSDGGGAPEGSFLCLPTLDHAGVKLCILKENKVTSSLDVHTLQDLIQVLDSKKDVLVPFTHQPFPDAADVCCAVRGEGLNFATTIQESLNIVNDVSAPGDYVLFVINKRLPNKLMLKYKSTHGFCCETCQLTKSVRCATRLISRNQLGQWVMTGASFPFNGAAVVGETKPSDSLADLLRALPCCMNLPPKRSEYPLVCDALIQKIQLYLQPNTLNPLPTLEQYRDQFSSLFSSNVFVVNYSRDKAEHFLKSQGSIDDPIFLLRCSNSTQSFGSDKKALALAVRSPHVDQISHNIIHYRANRLWIDQEPYLKSFDSLLHLLVCGGLVRLNQCPDAEVATQTVALLASINISATKGLQSLQQDHENVKKIVHVLPAAGTPILFNALANSYTLLRKPLDALYCREAALAPNRAPVTSPRRLIRRNKQWDPIEVKKAKQRLLSSLPHVHDSDHSIRTDLEDDDDDDDDDDDEKEGEEGELEKDVGEKQQHQEKESLLPTLTVSPSSDNVNASVITSASEATSTTTTTTRAAAATTATMMTGTTSSTSFQPPSPRNNRRQSKWSKIGAMITRRKSVAPPLQDTAVREIGGNAFVGDDKAGSFGELVTVDKFGALTALNVVPPLSLRLDHWRSVLRTVQNDPKTAFRFHDLFPVPSAPESLAGSGGGDNDAGGVGGGGGGGAGGGGRGVSKKTVSAFQSILQASCFWLCTRSFCEAQLKDRQAGVYMVRLDALSETPLLSYVHKSGQVRHLIVEPARSGIRIAGAADLGSWPSFDKLLKRFPDRFIYPLDAPHMKDMRSLKKKASGTSHAAADGTDDDDNDDEQEQEQEQEGGHADNDNDNGDDRVLDRLAQEPAGRSVVQKVVFIAFIKLALALSHRQRHDECDVILQQLVEQQSNRIKRHGLASVCCITRLWAMRGCEQVALRNLLKAKNAFSSALAELHPTESAALKNFRALSAHQHAWAEVQKSLDEKQLQLAQHLLTQAVQDYHAAIVRAPTSSVLAANKARAHELLLFVNSELESAVSLSVNANASVNGGGGGGGVVVVQGRDQKRKLRTGGAATNKEKMRGRSTNHGGLEDDDDEEEVVVDGNSVKYNTDTSIAQMLKQNQYQQLSNDGSLMVQPQQQRQKTQSVENLRPDLARMKKRSKKNVIIDGAVEREILQLTSERLLKTNMLRLAKEAEKNAEKKKTLITWISTLCQSNLLHDKFHSFLISLTDNEMGLFLTPPTIWRKFLRSVSDFVRQLHTACLLNSQLELVFETAMLEMKIDNPIEIERVFSNLDFRDIEWFLSFVEKDRKTIQTLQRKLSQRFTLDLANKSLKDNRQANAPVVYIDPAPGSSTDAAAQAAAAFAASADPNSPPSIRSTSSAPYSDSQAAAYVFSFMSNTPSEGDNDDDDQDDPATAAARASAAASAAAPATTTIGGAMGMMDDTNDKFLSPRSRSLRQRPFSPVNSPRYDETADDQGQLDDDQSLTDRRSSFRRMETVRHFKGYIIPSTELTRRSVIGSGAFGVVYKGTWRSCAVAIKEIPIHSEKARELFKKEASKMQTIRSHANVVPFYGVSIEPTFSIVTQYCAGSSLDQFLWGSHKGRTTTATGRRPPLSDMLILKFVTGISLGVHHLHEEGVIHRDLAARNILLSADLEPLVSDFGLARTIDKETDTTEAQTVSKIGPVKWMAPEQLSQNRYSTQSDVWALACVFYEILMRHEPWNHIKNELVIFKVLNGETLEVPASAPPYLRPLFPRMWQKMPQDRPSMSELVSIFINQGSERPLATSSSSMLQLLGDDHGPVQDTAGYEVDSLRASSAAVAEDLTPKDHGYLTWDLETAAAPQSTPHPQVESGYLTSPLDSMEAPETTTGAAAAPSKTKERDKKNKEKPVPGKKSSTVVDATADAKPATSRTSSKRMGRKKSSLVLSGGGGGGGGGSGIGKAKGAVCDHCNKALKKSVPMILLGNSAFHYACLICSQCAGKIQDVGSAKQKTGKLYCGKCFKKKKGSSVKKKRSSVNLTTTTTTTTAPRQPLSKENSK